MCTLSSDLIVRQIECSECLYEREKNEMMERTWRSDDLTLFCCNASPKYCAPWASIRFSDRSSVVSVCMKETGMNGCRRRWWNVVYSEKGSVSAYISLLLVRQESNASEMSVKWAEWMCMLYGGVSGKYRCSCLVPSRDSVWEYVSLFENYEAIWWCWVHEFWLLSYIGVFRTLWCNIYSIAQD